MAQGYEARLLRVLDYVYANLDGDLSLDTLADVAALSRFHFHRVFTGMTGETVAAFTRRVRLFRASIALVQTNDPVDQISTYCGYSNARSF
ncbi:MAG: AraC family transcriptional regulator, partial [Celeribacter sp.]